MRDVLPLLVSGIDLGALLHQERHDVLMPHGNRIVQEAAGHPVLAAQCPRPPPAERQPFRQAQRPQQHSAGSRARTFSCTFSPAARRLRTCATSLAFTASVSFPASAGALAIATQDNVSSTSRSTAFCRDHDITSARQPARVIRHPPGLVGIITPGLQLIPSATVTLAWQ